MNDRFQFLKTYGDTLIELEKADKDLARELAWKIIQYGIYNKNEDSGNPIIEAMFVQIKVMLDKGQDITEKRRKANLERTNISKKEQKLTNDEQKLTNEEQTIPKEKIEKIKEKKENIKEENNNLSVISANAQEEKKSYGNEDVNKCLSLIKQFNHGVINGSDANSRRYAWLLINKLKTFDSVVKGQYKREDILEGILIVVSKNEYHRTKISSPKLIFDNISTLVQVVGKESDKLKQKQETALQVI